MKKIFTLFTLVALLISACEPLPTPTPDNGNGNTDEKNLLITDSVINVTAQGGEYAIIYSISQEVEGVELEASTPTEWITDLVVADKITFKVAKNRDVEQRVGFINVSYGADEYTIGVEQRGWGDKSDIKLDVETTKVVLSAVGTSVEVKYTLTGADEEGAMPKATLENADWVTNIVVESDKVSFDVAANLSTQERKTTLYLNYDTATATISIVQEGSLEEAVLTASANVTRVGESVEFSVVFAGNDVTNECTFHEYYTHEQVSNPATFSKVGEYALYAKYNGESSNLVSISVFDASVPEFPVDSNPKNYDFKHRMLLIDHTGTDCGYCPLMMLQLKKIEEDPAYNDYFNLAVSHAYNSDDAASSTTSFMLTQYYQSIIRVLTGFPTLTFNYQYGESAGSNFTFIEKHFKALKKESTTAAVAVSTKLDGDKIVISASLKSKEADLYKVNILLLEDNIYSPQYNASESWMNYHNNAIRDAYPQLVYTDITGTEWGYVGAESTTHKVFEMPITDSKIVKQNCKVLVIIAAKSAEYDNKFEVVNTTLCGVNQSKPFEYR
ncbi:MAG: Omp28-related outer membrane protein [Alistipes sp.]|nr:Omp28-related outer membrane protein [Alistipes sp.]